MPNTDNAHGFTYDASVSRPIPILETGLLAISQTIAKGDALVFSGGQLSIALSNSGAIHGVAAEAKVTTGAATDTIQYIPATLDNFFSAQCSGSYSSASHDFVPCDIEGATGIMEVNENATTEGVFCITGMVNDGKNAEGTNARVRGYFIRSTYCPVLAAK